MSAEWHPQPGECLFIESGPIGKHLFVIVLDAKDGNQHQMVSVPVCTARDYAKIDPACIIQPGEHPFVKAESFVQYRDARIDPANHLIRCVKERTFTPHSPASVELLEKIKQGLLDSRFVKRYLKDLLNKA